MKRYKIILYIFKTKSVNYDDADGAEEKKSHYVYIKEKRIFKTCASMSAKTNHRYCPMGEKPVPITYKRRITSEVVILARKI